jgi:hypothetical protein
MALFRECADGYVGIADGQRTRLLHRVVAEMAIHEPLRASAVIHHVDGNKRNNFTCNLVICNDQAYHRLLHQRQEALESCGHPHWVKCRFCCDYDDPENMKRNESFDSKYNRRRVSYHHIECNRAYQRARYRNRTANKS